jgi:Fic family protein
VPTHAEYGTEGLPGEMDRLFRWFNATGEPDTLVRAALAHLWFEAIQSVEGGNRLLGRAQQGGPRAGIASRRPPL